MRKITELASKAFWDNGYFKQDNTTVLNSVMQLHRTNIAIYADGMLTLNTDGWYSNTTKERMNGVLNRLGWSVFQKNCKWYLYNSQTEESIPFVDGIQLRVGV